MVRDVQRFEARLASDVLRHPVIVANPFTGWFERGDFDLPQARAFVVQFSVFSNQFLLAQLAKMLNADTLHAMRESKEILANEIGVGFRDAGGKGGANAGTDDEFGAGAGTDAESGANYGAADDDFGTNNGAGARSVLGSPSGSVEGGAFRFRAAHFELLLRTARGLGLEFRDLGKRRFGSDSTLFFCDELIRLYGAEEYATAEAASWAVENWAAKGFWDQLVRGWQVFKVRRRMPNLNIGFFTWHARLEANHSRHTWDELEQWYRDHEVDEDAFVAHAVEMLDAVHAFWLGLDRQRYELATLAEDGFGARVGDGKAS